MIIDGVLGVHEPTYARYMHRRKKYIDANATKLAALPSLWPDPEEQYARTYRVEGSTAYIQIFGPLSERGPDLMDVVLGFGGTSYAHVRRAAQAAQDDVRVSDVVLLINSPGGGVDQLDETYQALAAIDKPVSAVNKGLAASAAYWLAVAADKITPSSGTVQTGSIGVMVNTYDDTAYLDGLGLAEITITNTDSPDKALDLTQDEGVDIIRAELDDIFDIFLGRVVAGRPASAAAVKKLKGRVVAARRAISIGLLDSRDAESDAPGNLSAMDPRDAEDQNENINNEENFGMDDKEKLDGLAVEVERLKAQLAAPPIDDEPTLEKTEAIEFAGRIAESEDYPKSVRSVAIRVLTGQGTSADLYAAVAAYDIIKQETASKIAGKTTEGLPETGPTKDAGAVIDEATGELKNEQAVSDEIKRIRRSA